MSFQKFGELRLGNAEVRSLERFPNLFAAGESSGIVATGFVTKEICPCFLPRFFLRFATLHGEIVEADREKRKQILICARSSAG